MAVRYARRDGVTMVDVSCDACDRRISSPSLTDVEMCALVGWSWDFGHVLCLLCQAAGDRWAFAARAASPGRAPTPAADRNGTPAR